jgi:hypothetical protein
VGGPCRPGRILILSICQRVCYQGYAWSTWHRTSGATSIAWWGLQMWKCAAMTQQASQLLSGFFGPSVDDVLANYDRVVSSRAPHIDPQHFKATNGRYVTEETIFLPLSDDGENVNIVLVFSQSRDSRSAAAPRACRE